MTDLAPCPFCGSTAELEDHRLCWFVRCSGCGAGVMGDRAPEPEQDLLENYWESFRRSAVERWNQRTSAALAVPVAKVVTDEEAQQLFDSLRTPIHGRLTTDTQDRVVGHEPVCPGDFARAVLARFGHQPAPPVEGEVVGPEWRPCVKLPITVHVREQRPGETHVSTREGITPVRPDDLIMRGVQGEEYPIGRELFEKTYRLGPAEPAPPAEDVLTDKELDALMPQQMRSDLEAAVVARSADLGFDKAIGICRFSVYKKARAYARAAIAADRARYSHQPAPPAEVAPGPTMEDVGPLIAWLTEQAHQAADASQPTDAGMLTWAAQVIGERVDEDAPAPSAAGEPSDENCWQWYTYCPEEGLEMYSDRKQAQSAAQSIMGSYEVAAHSDGWHEDMESVSWGMLVPVEQAQVVERKTADPDSEFDEWVKYELRPARYGNQPAPPAAACGGGG